MDINLQGKVPTARTLEEANQVIKALWDIIGQLNERKQTNSKCQTKMKMSPLSPK